MEQLELLSFMLELLDTLGIEYMVVGSIASGAYGEPRLTQDIDIVIDPDVDKLRKLCAALPPDDFYVSVEAVLAAARQPGAQFNVIHPESGNKFDFMIVRDDAWGRQQLARRQRLKLLAAREGYAARPDDIIISKMLYYQEGGSEKHLRDIAGILKVSSSAVDRIYLSHWAAQLGLTPILEAVLRKVDAPS